MRGEKEAVFVAVCSGHRVVASFATGEPLAEVPFSEGRPIKGWHICAFPLVCTYVPMYVHIYVQGYPYMYSTYVQRHVHRYSHTYSVPCMYFHNHASPVNALRT